jgi:predicted amidohydrolase YtcJ
MSRVLARSFLIIVITFSVIACSESQKSPAEIIYVGGNLITVNVKAPRAEAIAIKGGKIVAVGSNASVLKYLGEDTKVIELNGETLLPGFVDAHSHFSGVGMQAITANLLPFPDGPVNSIPALQHAMRAYIDSSPIVKKYAVAIGFNYDDSQLQEKRHPTRHDLDEISTDIPIVVMHQSGHLGVYNSKALEMMQINSQSANPAGGVIERGSDGVTPNGVMQENAHFMLIYKLVPDFSKKDYVDLYRAAEEQYIANGFTTVQEGKTDLKTLTTLPEIAESDPFKIDIIAYPDLVTIGDHPILHGPLMSKVYADGIRLGGIKLTFDGSPQGKTAWFTHPYLVPPAGQGQEFAGYPAFTDQQALDWFELAYKNNWQVLSHTNGDAAIDQLIKTVSAMAEAHPNRKLRNVMIHGQFLRLDQVKKLKQLEIFPALYPMHTFYWGDWHRDSVAGLARANNISPTGWLMDENMMFTIHSDAPVTFPNSMRLIDSAVNRTTRSNAVLGKEQRIEPLDAIKAMTLWAAYQHFEEDIKGSLEVGKNADLVILDKNPLSLAPNLIKDIRVLETIKDGDVIYLSPGRVSQ